MLKDLQKDGFNVESLIEFPGHGKNKQIKKNINRFYYLLFIENLRNPNNFLNFSRIELISFFKK